MIVSEIGEPVPFVPVRTNVIPLSSPPDVMMILRCTSSVAIPPRPTVTAAADAPEIVMLVIVLNTPVVPTTDVCEPVTVSVAMVPFNVPTMANVRPESLPAEVM